MIKRLKWNVLHGDDSESESNADETSSSGSESSTEQLDSKELLALLVKNDPFLRSDEDSESSSSDESLPEANEAPSKERSQGDISKGIENEEQSFIEWRECSLCPGKRFLNDREVEAHLKSRPHRRAEARFNKLRDQKQGNTTTARRSKNAEKAKGVATTPSEVQPKPCNSESLCTVKKKKKMGKAGDSKAMQTTTKMPDVLSRGRGQTLNGDSKADAEERSSGRDNVAPDLTAKKAKSRKKLKYKRLKRRKWLREQQAKQNAAELGTPSNQMCSKGGNLAQNNDSKREAKRGKGNEDEERERMLDKKDAVLDNGPCAKKKRRK